MRKELFLILLLFVLCAVMAFMNPDFFGSVNLQNNARLVGMYGLFSIGVGIVICSGGIDLSIGSSVALLGVILAMLINPGDPQSWQWPWYLAVIVVLLVGAMQGLIHGFLITVIRVQPFIVTLCGLLVYRGLARFIAHDESRGLGTHQGFETLSWLATGKLAGVPNQFWCFFLVAIVMWIVLHHTVYGRYLLATGRNEEAARYSGINTRKIIFSAYVIGSSLTAVAAILFAFYTNSVQASSHGNFYELYAIAGAVLGGCSLRGGEGSIIGIVIGTILLALLRNMVNLLGIESALEFAVMGGVILLGVIVDQLLLLRRQARRAA